MLTPKAINKVLTDADSKLKAIDKEGSIYLLDSTGYELEIPKKAQTAGFILAIAKQWAEKVPTGAVLNG